MPLSHANKALLFGHVSRLSDRRFNLGVRSLGEGQEASPLLPQQPGIIAVLKVLYDVRIFVLRRI